MSISQWEKELETILEEFKQQTSLTGSDIFVVGCSTSEVTGNKIGTSGTEEVAAMILGK